MSYPQSDSQGWLMRISLPASLSSLCILHEKLLEFIQPLQVDSASSYAVELALNEAFINIVKHGVNYDSTQNITIVMHYGNNQLAVTLQDKGKPIPAEFLQNKSGLSHFPELSAPDSWPENGMGMMMMFNAVDDISYKVKEGVNYLSLIKKIEEQT
ncbi:MULTISPECIES: ATP-binding protein [Yersinia]|uniref:ATP-binding protein n=1 Tax=Yersinia TaxID=629 RepID=UPI0005DF3BB5|nr:MULTISPECIES: ATP-binding protein [Yersinia]MCB5299482.1 ATP-binding protein [Yersinia intermedia]MDA5511048.1 ATP-binding protein [Yersinia intermedia]CND56515.1 serine-protein kinase RsbW [Yersinia intermedia]CNH11165.1 serine-protein kinase RsbW [Yersinia intermedia]CNJ55976.1 serine-protein kinase RsbW [Yersinia intermedia]